MKSRMKISHPRILSRISLLHPAAIGVCSGVEKNCNFLSIIPLVRFVQSSVNLLACNFIMIILLGKEILIVLSVIDTFIYEAYSIISFLNLLLHLYSFSYIILFFLFIYKMFLFFIFLVLDKLSVCAWNSVNVYDGEIQQTPDCSPAKLMLEIWYEDFRSRTYTLPEWILHINSIFLREKNKPKRVHRQFLFPAKWMLRQVYYKQIMYKYMYRYKNCMCKKKISKNC